MSLLEIVILLPLLAAVAVWLGAPARLVSVGSALLNLALMLGAAAKFKAAAAGGLAFTSARVVLDNPSISFAVGLDGTSLILGLLTALVTLAAVWQIADDRPPIYHTASQLIAAGAFGAFLCTDLFFIYAFHEL